MKRAAALLLLLLLVARPAQTVGVEAWHDSAVPASAFMAVLPPQAAHASQVSATRPTAAREFRGQPPAAETSTARRAVDALPSLAPASRPSLGVAASVTGTASTYGPGYDGYLALPAGPGIHVRICGAGGCIDRVSNDKGPVPSLHRVADLSVADFEYVSGLPWTRGLCRVSVEVLAP